MDERYKNLPIHAKGKTFLQVCFHKKSSPATCQKHNLYRLCGKNGVGLLLITIWITPPDNNDT